MFSARKRAAQRPARMMRRESRSLLEEQAEGFAAVEAESSESAFVQGEDVAANPRPGGQNQGGVSEIHRGVGVTGHKLSSDSGHEGFVGNEGSRQCS